MAANLIFNMPFDESANAVIAYDYSSNRADGNVIGATFVPGKNGSAIQFQGQDTCETDKNVLPNLGADFTILTWVKPIGIKTGSPRKLIWLLNFIGLEKYYELLFEATTNTWYSLALTRTGNVFNFYVNATLLTSFVNAGNLVGVSLNQDYYGGEYGLGLLDDVKIYDAGLTQAEIIEALSTQKKQAYLLDGVDFKEYGIYVSDSDGVVSRPKLKPMQSVSWDNYHGEAVDLMHKFYEPREIVLSCFIKAATKNDFITKVTAFEQLFDKQGTQRLVLDVHPIKPLIYEVYCKDEIAISKKWNNELMVGTFKLKLIEPEPVKRILKHTHVDANTKTCTVTLTSIKYVNIFWGDGTVDYDVAGENITITHDYAEKGDYFPVITGCIDEITSFSTNAIIVWSKI